MIMIIPCSFIFPAEMCAGMVSVAGLAPCSSYHPSEFEPRPPPVVECSPPPTHFAACLPIFHPQIKIMRSGPSLKRNDGDALTYIRHAMWPSAVRNFLQWRNFSLSMSPYFSSCLKREVGAGGGAAGVLSPNFNSCLIRVSAAKHLPCSSPTPIHITPVLLHP